MITIQPIRPNLQLLEVFSQSRPQFKAGKVPQPKRPLKPRVAESTKKRIELVESYRKVITERLALNPNSPTGIVWKVTGGRTGCVGYHEAGTVAGARGKDPVVVINGQRLSIRLIISLLSSTI